MRTASSTSPIVHREDAEFIERITRLARSSGLDADVEYVGPDDSWT